MKVISVRRFLVMSGVSALALLSLIALWLFISLQTAPPKSLAKLAKSVIKMDLQAPKDHGWLSDHEIFFLREKNQGDFLCVKTDIRDGTETVIEELSPYLQGHEERGDLFKLESSPSGKRLAMTFGSQNNPQRWIHDFESNNTALLMKEFEYNSPRTWLPDENGWIEWKETVKKGLGSVQEANYFTISNLTNPILQITSDSKNIYSPRFTDSNLLHHVFVNFDTRTFKFIKSSIHLTTLTLDNEHSIVQRETKKILENSSMFLNSLSFDQFAQNCLIVHHSKRAIKGIKKTDTFPFFKLQDQVFQIKIYNLQENQWTILDPDIEIKTSKNPRTFQLNPSGTHFSFIYQGQIWIVKISDFIK